MRWYRTLRRFCTVRTTSRAVVSAALAGAATSACSLVFPAPSPMRTVNIPADTRNPSRCLVVFLPGFGDSAEAYEDHGFVDALRARSMAVDTVSANATFGYYAGRTLLTRLHEDVFAPARRRGYGQIWVVGTSMGGMGALLLSKQEPTALAGIFLMAPYLGDIPTLREIDQAGGLARWRPPSIAPDDYQRGVWRYVQELTKRPGAGPALYLGAGETDKLRYGQTLLGAVLPPDHVFSTPGGHDWGPWSVLWAEFLDRSDFRERCAGPDR